MLLAAAAAAGAEAVDLGIARDVEGHLEGCLDRALQASVDVLVTSGNGMIQDLRLLLVGFTGPLGSWGLWCSLGGRKSPSTARPAPVLLQSCSSPAQAPACLLDVMLWALRAAVISASSQIFGTQGILIRYWGLADIWDSRHPY
jgi:hypothetical protein